MLIIKGLSKVYHETQEGVLLVSEQLFNQFVENDARLREENDKLRKALKAIASEGGVSEGYQYADQVANDLISTAKSALEETK